MKTNSLPTVISKIKIAYAEKAKIILCETDYPNGFPAGYVLYAVRKNAFESSLADGKRFVRSLTAKSRKRLFREAREMMTFDFVFDRKNADAVEDFQFLNMLRKIANR